MSYVIVSSWTGAAHRKHNVVAVYPTERGAKIVCTKLNTKVVVADKGIKLVTHEWAVFTYATYMDRPVKMVERTNALTGAKFMEAEDTPYFCSPSSESYWAN